MNTFPRLGAFARVHFIFLMQRLLLPVLLVLASCNRPPGWRTSFHELQVLDNRDLNGFTCPLSDDLIPGIPLTFTNGSCHDLLDPRKGASGELQVRLLEPSYADNRGAPSGQLLPSPRDISNAIAREDVDLPNIKLASRNLIFFGQFMDHDFALILEQPEPEELEDEDKVLLVRPEVLEVEIPEDDEQFEEPMEFGRSVFELDSRFVRQFKGAITPWLDLGNVYGDTSERTARLRAGTDGLLRVDDINGGDFPFFEDIGSGESEPICGDIRCSENTMLFGWHTLFLRNHNYWADEFRQETGSSNDDEIFENARVRNIVEYQFIVWEQYLPYLLGRRTFEEITGEYELDPDLSPVCSLEFTTAVFRYGHSGVSNDLQFMDENLEQTRGTVALAEAFMNVDPVTESTSRLGELFIAQGVIPHPVLDSRVVSGIRDNLFANLPDSPAFDLISRNIERGRDHGIQSFTRLREEAGLPPFLCPDDPRDCFTQLTADEQIAESLFELYGDIEQCELWPCGMAEDSFQDSLLGQTFTLVMAQQFNRMRNSDRLWYDNIIGILEDSPAPVSLPVTLLDIVVRNTGATMPEGVDNLFMVTPTWLAFASDTQWQVEWFLPPSLRETLTEYEIAVRGRATVTQAASETLFFLEPNASPGTEYEVTVRAVLTTGETMDLGTTSFSTTGSSGLSTAALVGIAVGATAVGLGVVALGLVYFARNKPYSIIGRMVHRNDSGGGASDDFLTM